MEKQAMYLTMPSPRTAWCWALGEAEVVEVRGVERLAIDVVLHGRLDEDFKDPAQLEAVGAGQRVEAEDDVKDVMEG